MAAKAAISFWSSDIVWSSLGASEPTASEMTMHSLPCSGEQVD